MRKEKVGEQQYRKSAAWGSSSRKNRGKTIKATDLKRAVRRLGASNTPEINKAIRAAQARRVWETVAPQEILDHTDNVYLLNNNGIKEMVVRVDSSLWAAELTAQSEQFRRMVEETLGEELAGGMIFKVDSYINKKKEFKRHKQEKPSYIDDAESIPLTYEERMDVYEDASKIGNSEVREALIKARIKDLEWKKGINGKTSL